MICHKSEKCPDTPCEAEIKIFCKCKWWFEMGICGVNSGQLSNEIKIECNKECLKNERDTKIAEAFKTKDEKAVKDLRADFYP